MNKIYVYLEIPYDDEIGIFATTSKNPCIDILKKYKYRSEKSLINFLNKYKDDIINSIPSSENEFLDKLEEQKYLDYLNNKWYSPYIITNNVTPEEILDMVIKYDVDMEKNISKYILKNEPDFTYMIHTQLSE